MQFIFTPNSKRAQRARLAVKYGSPWAVRSYAITGSSTLLISGYLLYSGYSAGYLLLIVTSIAAILYAWSKGDLNNDQLPPIEGVEIISVDQYLDQPTIAKLQHPDPSAYELWKAIQDSEQDYFLGNRFLIGPDFFETLLSQSSGSARMVWEIAEDFRRTYQLPGYSNMVILVSLIKTVPNYEQILRSVQIDFKDIQHAIPWIHDVMQKRQLARSKRFLGGIGRDWAFGYAPILQRLGHNISRDIELYGFFSDTSMHIPIVNQMSQMLSSGNGTVTLVGDNGVGKTTCVHALADHLLSSKDVANDIRNRQIVSLDAPTLLANAQHPGQIEELTLMILNEAIKAKNIILFFDDAEVFFGIGSSIDLSHVIQPALEAHSLKIILAMSPSAWQKLAGTNAIGKMQPLNIQPPGEEDSLAILRDSITLAEYKNKVIFTYQALREAYKLGGRYVTNLAMPGAALTLLEQTAATTDQKLITRDIVQASVEQTYGIKLQTSSATESSKLLNLEAELHKHVINQDRAVKVVSDALRRARSGIGNPNRPVGTFLFLGPTGVGKTELSKALARVYFGSETAIIRVDMNQYITEGDLARLVAPMHGNELGFLGQVRKQPFSVILLDEIEKAHASVVNSLLQMLDEGVMQDADSRSVSFKDSIIIATSNAGADQIRSLIDSGADIDQAESQFIETLISQGYFAPEFVNRFDEVVLFKPLNQDELLAVVDIILKQANQNLNEQKIKIDLTLAAKQWLVQKGYDPKLGARPMRRMVQRHVENVVAKKLLEQSIHPGQAVMLDVKDLENS